MREVLDLIEVEAAPFFERTRSVNGLLDCLEGENWGSGHHLEFEIGCCLARLGRDADARAHLEEALRAYAADGRDWCAPEMDRVRALLAALQRNEALALLGSWELESIRSLHLGRLVEPPPRRTR